MTGFKLPFQNESAVPLFAVSDDAGITELVRIDFWRGFIEQVGEFQATQTLHVAVKSFFDNGGGRCYLLPTSQWATMVPDLDDVTLLVAAGQDILKLVAHLCQPGKYLFALLDGPQGQITAESRTPYPSTSYAAAYYPWLSADWAETPIPPSAAVAGVACKVDREQGFWKAPANAPLYGVKPVLSVSDGQEAQNRPFNAIREFRGRGTLVWGATTLAPDSDEFKYIPVRRSVDTIANVIESMLVRMAFQPNTKATWDAIDASVKGFLFDLWKHGGLSGTKEADAYSIQIGEGITMTAEEAKKGLGRVQVGLAIFRPGEFVTISLRFQTKAEA